MRRQFAFRRQYDLVSCREGVILAVVAVTVAALSGCGLGPMASSHGPVTGSIAGAQLAAAQSTGISEIHSSTCPGLELERQERLKRIAQLQKTVLAELDNTPTTIAHALARASSTPEQGTNAYASIMEERAFLASIATASARVGCPPVSSATAQE